jgi:hypothetical protein
MKVLVQELWDQLNDLGDSTYYVLGTLSTEHIKKFLFATMDEVRLRYAASCTKSILKSSDIEDADHFRQGLLRREVTKDIAYNKQRDHSAHTLYNYLMGWYIAKNCPLIENKIKEQFKKRNWDEAGIYFINVWPFASLLHDVGYLFEGGLNPLSTDIQSKQVNIGAEVANDYFSHRFWIESGADSIYDRERLRVIADVREPDFSNHSLAGVADTLRSLGNLEHLRVAVRNERTIKGVEVPSENDYINIKNGLPGDAFDLWQRHYEYFGFSSMAERIRSMRLIFESLIRDGLGNTGLRVLDHGVCSGLLLLLYSTFYFRMYFGLGDTPPSDENDRAIWTRFRNASLVNPPPPFVEGDYDSLWWWTGIVWGTAATALHNIQQLRDMGPQYGHIEKLTLDEDALVYMGILVDCIQEWDRYTVSRESVIAGLLPLQGADVKLSSEGGKIHIDYGDSDRAKKVEKALSGSLSDEWKEIIDIMG